MNLYDRLRHFVAKIFNLEVPQITDRRQVDPEKQQALVEDLQEEVKRCLAYSNPRRFVCVPSYWDKLTITVGEAARKGADVNAQDGTGRRPVDHFMQKIAKVFYRGRTKANAHQTLGIGCVNDPTEYIGDGNIEGLQGIMKAIAQGGIRLDLIDVDELRKDYPMFSSAVVAGQWMHRPQPTGKAQEMLHEMLVVAVENDNVKQIYALYLQGAKMDAPSMQELSPLELALERGSYNAAQQLEDLRADTKRAEKHPGWKQYNTWKDIKQKARLKVLAPQSEEVDAQLAKFTDRLDEQALPKESAVAHEEARRATPNSKGTQCG